MNEHARILLIGYGNPGRLDDGLGPAVAAAVERLGIDGLAVEANYQLTVEDAETVAACEVVIFADASTEDDAEPFSFKRIRPSGNGGNPARFTSHHLAPADVLELAGRLFGESPEAYLLAIRGYDFNEFGEGLSEWAKRNLAEAVEFLDASIRLRLAMDRPAAPHRRIA